MSKSWKHSFQAHRVAANMGNLGDNFVYHREQQSFPLPMQRVAPAQRKRPNMLQVKGRQLLGRLLPGGNNGAVGSLMGFGLPVLGCAVLFSFIYSTTNSNAKQYAQVQQAIEFERLRSEEV
mmetsp:Transcript_100447/g.259881  ORF Transcript_100447/g.259881 Transcript_100447/m.259881 type:complete len:121 (-) Transcript_100447:12-374(-)